MQAINGNEECNFPFILSCHSKNGDMHGRNKNEVPCNAQSSGRRVHFFGWYKFGSIVHIGF